ncbi:transmembrane and immunoglobulin domain-containing protein 1 [Genypterus blacodes]|uniref:transmembrane and immunoglobulin domain-containing protein 1 n=1 Tax=Genypterus blacodes TaxID=154954 RepID=UPI003F75CCDE
MKLMCSLHVFHFLLLCATQTSGVKIDSAPDINGEGLIVTGVNQTVSLLCQAGTDEELVWLRNGARIALKGGNNTRNSSVCVTPVILEDNGATFTCQMKKNASVSASVTLDVIFPPLLSGSAEVLVEELEALVLQCDIWSNPPVSSVTWTQNGSSLDLTAGGFTATTDGFTAQLISNSAERSLHQGAYQCTAKTPKNEIFSKIFNVIVTDKTLKFPLMPIIAGVVVVFLTSILAVLARWHKIRKCCK